MSITSVIKKSFIILSLTTPIMASAAGLTNLKTQEIQQHHTKNKALIIDIRTQQEWNNTGIIPNSHPLTFFDRQGHYDVEKWLVAMRKLQSSPNQEIILVCRSGNRSARAGHYLSDILNLPNISHLKQGMNAWLNENRPTDKICTATKTC